MEEQASDVHASMSASHLKQWCIFHPGTAFALALVPEGPSPAKHSLQTHLSCAGRTVVETARAHYGDVVGFMCKDRLWATWQLGTGFARFWLCG